MNETRVRDSSDPRDDWLGDLSDDDWDEGAFAPAQPSLPATRQARVREDAPDMPRPVRTPDVEGTDFTRRRVVAGSILVAVAALAGVLAFVVFGGNDESPTTPVSQPVTSPTTTETTTETTPSTGTTTTSTQTSTTQTTTTETTTTPTTTQPESGGATGFTLPEGTKLQRDAENDAAVVRELQQALTAAGYDPGPADGTYGEQTEAAVVAFQQANGLAVDGRVGPETAAALNSALATG
ncbi:MAG TPA: peptidoglycan-binding domain-containing protein [Gaiella sp.]|nr:peptidoglycan-binding domain-containing protein [Gaiella sp.]